MLWEQFLVLTTEFSATKVYIISIYRTLQKPLGIGIIVGTITGFSNSLILGLPLLSSLAIGGALGLSVCLFGCPGMMKDKLLLVENWKSNDEQIERDGSASSRHLLPLIKRFKDFVYQLVIGRQVE